MSRDPKYSKDPRQPQNFRANGGPNGGPNGGWTRHRKKRNLLALPMIALLAACETPDMGIGNIFNSEVRQTREISVVEAGGYIAGDEPQAIQVMQSAIEQGGTAADAMLAGFFSLALTYPIAVSPASGGACLIFEGRTAGLSEEDTAKIKYLSFPVTRPARGGNVGVPGAVRGLWTLHLEYGKLRWSRMILPRLPEASRGIKMSRALRTRITPFEDVVRSRPRLAAFVAGPNGDIAEVGQPMQNPEIIPLISAIGQKGPSALYSGALSIQYVQDANSLGGNMSTDDLQVYQPQWLDPITIEDGDTHWAWSNNSGGRKAAKMLAGLGDKAGSADTEADLLHLINEGTHWVRQEGLGTNTQLDVEAEEARFDAFYDASQHKEILDPNPVRVSIDGGTTSLVATDSSGLTIGCSFGLNGPFGAGEVAPGLGIMLPAAPQEGTKDSIDQTVLGISTWGNRRRLLTAITASGGVSASNSVVTTLIAGELRGEDTKTGLAAPRAINPGNPNAIFAEDSLTDEAVSNLRDRGHQIREMPLRMGRVQVFDCRYSLVKELPDCGIDTDPRNAGLSRRF